MPSFVLPNESRFAKDQQGGDVNSVSRRGVSSRPWPSVLLEIRMRRTNLQEQCHGIGTSRHWRLLAKDTGGSSTTW